MLLWRSNKAARHCQDRSRVLQYTLLFSSPKVFLSSNEALMRGYCLDPPLKHMLVFEEGHGREESSRIQSFYLMLGRIYLPYLIVYFSLHFIFPLTGSVTLPHNRIVFERRLLSTPKEGRRVFIRFKSVCLTWWPCCLVTLPLLKGPRIFELLRLTTPVVSGIKTCFLLVWVTDAGQKKGK